MLSDIEVFQIVAAISEKLSLVPRLLFFLIILPCDHGHILLEWSVEGVEGSHP